MTKDTPACEVTGEDVDDCECAYPYDADEAADERYHFNKDEERD
jgi:hypothetical protein